MAVRLISADRGKPCPYIKEIRHFFSIYKDLEEKPVEVEGWHGLDEAVKVIRESKERYKP